MSAHTPGPWKVEYSEGDEWEVLAGANLPIAYISGWAGRSTEVNARLIAAAPDLLAALAGIIEIGKRDLTNPKYDAYFEEARAALKKARGGQ